MAVFTKHFSAAIIVYSQKFPFAIYYKIERHTVFVYNVLDCRRDPVWINKRLT
jgi:hypothetical protein